MPTNLWLMAEPHFEQIHGRIKNSFSATSVLSMLSFRSMVRPLREGGCGSQKLTTTSESSCPVHPISRYDHICVSNVLDFFPGNLDFFSIIIPSSKLIGKDDKATTSPSTTLQSHSSLKDLKQAQADPCCTSTITMNDLVQHHSRKHQLRPQWATDPQYGSIWQF